MGPSTEDDILEIRRKLVKVIDGKKEMNVAVDLIDALQKMPISVEILTNTRIGLTLNDLRKKTTDEVISKRCKALIKKWKSLIDGRSSSERSIKSQSIEPEVNGSLSQPRSQEFNSTQLENVACKVKVNGLVAQHDDLRSKTVQLIKSALRMNEMPDGTLDPEELAMRIEDKLHEHYKGTGDKYRASVRSRVFNLRDKKNQALRENVLTGAINAEQFALMSAEEMASDEMKSVRDRFAKESIMDHQMAIQEGTPTDMFRCGKCGKNNCTYSQMQTRSADEPMTTFVYCRTCGNRWKFC